MSRELKDVFGNADTLTPHGQRKLVIVSGVAGAVFDSRTLRMNVPYFKAFLALQLAGHDIHYVSDSSEAAFPAQLVRDVIPGILQDMGVSAADQKPVIDDFKIERGRDVLARDLSGQGKMIDVVFDAYGSQMWPTAKLMVRPGSTAFRLVAFISGDKEHAKGDMTDLLDAMAREDGSRLLPGLIQSL